MEFLEPEMAYEVELGCLGVKLEGIQKKVYLEV